MILELLEYLLTPVPPWTRSLGFLRSAIEVRARYRRCRTAWQPHLDATQSWILRTAQACPSKRKVVLLGAGLLHDVPLRALASLFSKVVLVDAVHPLSSRLASLPFPNVSREALDVTGLIHALHSNTPENPVSLPDPLPRPTRFLDDPELDLTLSLNLLSQLPWIPSKLLAPHLSETQLTPFLQAILRAHLDYLRQLPGQTALVSDFQWSRVSPDGTPRETWNVLHGLRLPPPTLQWEWNIAPAPELEPDHHFIAHVAAYSDWKAV
jgi:hypothetical protein